ncbi:MAG: MFS transporter [Solirubrobacteraceae bacterium]
MALIGVRGAILVSIIPGLLAALAIVYAIRQTRSPTVREHRPVRLRIRPLMHGSLGRLLAAAAFELGNLAATLLILRATELLEPRRSHSSAAQLALVLYALYNLAATITSIPAGRLGDRRGMLAILTAGAICFLAAYIGFAATGESFALLAVWFLLAGDGIGAAETAETAAVATLTPERLRGSAFGLLAAVQAAGDLAASVIARILWSAVSPTAAFLYVAAWMGLAVIGLLTATVTTQRSTTPG